MHNIFSQSDIFKIYCIFEQYNENYWKTIEKVAFFET